MSLSGTTVSFLLNESCDTFSNMISQYKNISLTYIDEAKLQFEKEKHLFKYIDDENNGIDSFFKRCYIFYEFTYQFKGVKKY